MPEQKQDVTNNPPGERSQAQDQDREQQPPKGPGQPSPGLKDKDAPTSDSYGDTRDSGDAASR